MMKLWIACVGLMAAAPALGQSECRIAEIGKEIAIEVERFSTPGQRTGVEDAARLLIPSPCESSPAPRLALENVELGLLAEEWRQGTAALERNRLNR